LMGFLSEAVSEALRNVKRGPIALSIVRSTLLLSPVWSIIVIITIIQLMSVESVKRFQELNFGLIAGALASAPFQVLGSRVTSDSRYLGVLSPLLGTSILMALSYPPEAYLISKQLALAFHVKFSGNVALAAELTGAAYTLNCMVISSWGEHRWRFVLQIAAAWTLFSLIFSVLLLVVPDVLYVFLISASILVATLSACLTFNVLEYIDDRPRITATYVLGSVIVATAAILDYFMIMVSSVMYYAMVFFDKILIWSEHGFPFPPLDTPAFIGMIPLIAGTFAAGSFWTSVGDDLDRVYEARRNEISRIQRRVFLRFLRGIGMSIAMSGVFLLLLILLVGPEFRYWAFKYVVYLIGPTLGALSASLISGGRRMSAKTLLLPLGMSVPSLLTWLNLRLSANADLTMMYALGSVPGALVVYMYPQLIAFRREIEATVALALVPVAEILAWRWWGIEWVALGYLAGTSVSAAIYTLVAVRMWLDLRAEVCRILSYNNFVSYVIEIPRHGGERL